MHSLSNFNRFEEIYNNKFSADSTKTENSIESNDIEEVNTVIGQLITSIDRGDDHTPLQYSILKERIRNLETIAAQKEESAHGWISDDKKMIDSCNKCIKNCNEIMTRIYRNSMSEGDAQQFDAVRKFLLSFCKENKIEMDRREESFFYLFTHFLSEKGPEEIDSLLTELLSGAHFQLDDGGKLYDLLSKKERYNTKRWSSHYKEDKTQQYSISDGPLTREILYGKTTVAGKNCSWFQAEAHSTVGAYDTFAHAGDFINYKMSGKNQGPHGESAHLDNNPIKLKLANPQILEQF